MIQIIRGNDHFCVIIVIFIEIDVTNDCSLVCRITFVGSIFNSDLYFYHELI